MSENSLTQTTLVEEGAPFQLRAANMTLLTLKILNPSDPEFMPRLKTMLSLAPGFYRAAPIILDLSATGTRAPMDMAAFVAELKGLGVNPVGVSRANAAWERASIAAGLPPFPSGREAEVSQAQTRPAAKLSQGGTKIIREPIRSGRQVYAHKGDLIVLGPVSHGAELLADGHIHVYGPLRGRALAGMGGDKTARIFCRNLEAELVSIAGLYLVSEQLDQQLYGKAATISLVDERLVQEAL